MTHEEYMKLAIEVARQSEKDGGPAIGVIIVKDGKVVAEGKSLVWPLKDPSSHGEVNCIRAACKKLDTLDLHECTMYGTLEPCGMCLSTAAWANLSTIYFGAYRKDVFGNHYEIRDWEAEKSAQAMNMLDGVVMKVEGGILQGACAQLMDGYKNWAKE